MKPSNEEIKKFLEALQKEQTNSTIATDAEFQEEYEIDYISGDGVIRWKLKEDKNDEKTKQTSK